MSLRVEMNVGRLAFGRIDFGEVLTLPLVLKKKLRVVEEEEESKMCTICL